MVDSSLHARDKQYIWHPFTSLKSDLPVLPVARGEGPWLHTTDGRKILDAVSSWWVNIHGHANPLIAEAIARQANTLEQVIFAGFTHEPAVALAEQLLPVVPGKMEKLFFSDNGSTSVEVALKLAIQYWHNQGAPRKRIVAFEGAYHGDTFGAMAVGDRHIFVTPFAEHLFAVDFLPFPNGQNDAEVVAEMEKLVAGGEVAAFIFEPLVQGSAGMRMYAATTLERLIEAAKKQEVICIADEVMTGFGRTGLLFACDHLQQSPDMVCMSKGLTGGFLPMGVTASNQRIVAAFSDPSSSKTFFHGHSYTANPLACAAALASLQITLSEACMQQRDRIGQAHEVFAEEMRKHPAIAEVRSLGTIIALELASEEGTGYFNKRRDEMYRYFLERNILLRPLGNVLYILPPYVMSEVALASVYEAIRNYLAIIAE